MNIKSIVFGLLAVAGFFSMPASAQELMASNSYLSPSCTWQYSYSEGNPAVVHIVLLKCYGAPVLTRIQYASGSTCYVNNPASGYTLAGPLGVSGNPDTTLCSGFTLHKNASVGSSSSSSTPAVICNKTGTTVVAACGSAPVFQEPTISYLINQTCGNGCRAIGTNHGAINGCGQQNPWVVLKCQ